MDYQINLRDINPNTQEYLEAVAWRKSEAFGFTFGVAHALNTKKNSQVEFHPNGTSIEGSEEEIKLIANDITYMLPLVEDIQKRLRKKIKVSSINQTNYNPQDKDSTNATDVIETWGNEAWIFTIRGLLIDMDTHGRPLKHVTAFANVVKQHVLFKVEGQTFSAIGVNQIFIEDIEINPVVGFQDTEAYTITARSYTPLNLELS